MCPTLQSHLLWRVMLGSDSLPGGRCEPLLEVLSVGPSSGPPPVDHRPATALALRGELCRYSANEIRKVMLDLASDAMDLVLDLRDVEFLDCGALRLLVDVHREVSAHGGRLVLENVPPAGRRLFAISALDHLLVPSASARWP